MNNSFYALFVVLLFLIVITRANIHVVFLTCVAIALFITINWCVIVVAHCGNEEC